MDRLKKAAEEAERLWYKLRATLALGYPYLIVTRDFRGRRN